MSDYTFKRHKFASIEGSHRHSNRNERQKEEEGRSNRLTCPGRTARFYHRAVLGKIQERMPTCPGRTHPSAEERKVRMTEACRLQGCLCYICASPYSFGHFNRESPRERG